MNSEEIRLLEHNVNRALQDVDFPEYSFIRVEEGSSNVVIYLGDNDIEYSIRMYKELISSYYSIKAILENTLPSKKRIHPQN